MNQSEGIILLCNSYGIVVDVVHNPPDLGISIQPGSLFTRLAASGSLARALTFLNDIRTQGPVFNQEINIMAKERVKTLHFVGSMLAQQVLIVGAPDSRTADQIYEEMMSINNEQANSLRAALKEATQPDTFYTEISRLNNDLMVIQRELAKTNAELQRLNSEKNHFLGMAAHDLRNPLHTILIHSEFLADQTNDPQEREFLQVISEASHFMAHLIDDLLDVAKIEAGKLQLDYSVVDLADLLQRNAALNRPLAERKGVELDYNVASLPRMLVDSAKIVQVLNNLIGNAVKFSPSGSRVSISVEEMGDSFLIRVADHGPGLQPEQMARLFTPFQQGQPGSWGEKSTGLGLVIVKRIVEGHGGDIWCESVPGQGATFFVAIPQQPPLSGKGAR